MASTSRPPRLTPKLRELVARDRHDRPAVGRLTAAQVATLSAVARGEDRFTEPVSIAHALIALAAGTRPELALPVLADVVADREAPRSDRVTAARELGRLATPEAQTILVRRADDPEPRVQQAVLAALGRFADPAALRALTKIIEPGDLAARRQLALTRALIAHRHGLSGPFLAEVNRAEHPPVPPGQLTTLTLGRKTARVTATDRAKLLGSTYGIELADRAYGLACGKARWTLFMNVHLGDSVADVTQVFERAWIVGLLARWIPERIAVATQYVVLSRPVRGSARIDVIRADGQVLYTGLAERGDAEPTFSIGDVDRPGTAPTRLAGRVTGRGAVLDLSVASASRVGTRATTDVQVSR